MNVERIVLRIRDMFKDCSYVHALYAHMSKVLNSHVIADWVWATGLGSNVTSAQLHCSKTDAKYGEI